MAQMAARPRAHNDAEPVGASAETATGTYPRVVESVTSAGLTQADVARILKVNLRTVGGWAAGVNAPTGRRVRELLDLQYLVEELRELFTDHGVQIWLNGRNRALEGQRPVALLLAGRYEDVLAQAQDTVRGGM